MSTATPWDFWMTWTWLHWNYNVHNDLTKVIIKWGGMRGPTNREYTGNTYQYVIFWRRAEISKLRQPIFTSFVSSLRDLQLTERQTLHGLSVAGHSRNPTATRRLKAAQAIWLGCTLHRLPDERPALDVHPLLSRRCWTIRTTRSRRV